MMDSAELIPGHETNDRMSAVDAGFLYLERKELPLAIGNVSVFTGAIPFDRFVETIKARLPLLPRYRQKIARPLLDIARPTWQDDPDFNIQRHIFQVELDPPGTEAQLRALAGRIFSTRMDRGKPLWELSVVGGLEHGRSALITKVHHAMADGVSGMALMEMTLDASPKARALPRPKPYRPNPAPHGFRQLFDPVAGGLRADRARLGGYAEGAPGPGSRHDPRSPYSEYDAAVCSPVTRTGGSPERLPFNRPCGAERRLAWSEFSLADVRAIRAACGGTLNDIALTILIGAVRRYLQIRGETVSKRFCRVMVPVNVRTPDNTHGLGNRVSLLALALPLEVPDPVDRLHAVIRRTAVMKKAPVAGAIALLGTLTDATPAPVQALLSATPFVSLPFPPYNVLCTNVPGPPTPRYVCGKRMLSSYPHVPTGYEAGVSLAVESYNDKIYFGLTVDPQAAPEGEQMKDLLDISFAELVNRARRLATTGRASDQTKWRKLRAVGNLERIHLTPTP